MLPVATACAGVFRHIRCFALAQLVGNSRMLYVIGARRTTANIAFGNFGQRQVWNRAQQPAWRRRNALSVARWHASW